MNEKSADPRKDGNNHNLRVANRPPSTNTKTKLDLTKAYRDLSQTPYSGCKVKNYFLIFQIISWIFLQ